MTYICRKRDESSTPDPISLVLGCIDYDTSNIGSHTLWGRILYIYIPSIWVSLAKIWHPSLHKTLAVQKEAYWALKGGGGTLMVSFFYWSSWAPDFWGGGGG